MARIEAHAGSAAFHPFEDEADLTVIHGFGRRPMVQILVKHPGGLYGFSGFGDSGYGYTDAYVILADANFFLFHEDESRFRVLMNNFYTGEVVFI